MDAARCRQRGIDPRLYREAIAADAQRMAARIVSRCKRLVRFSTSGQMVPEYQNVELREVLEGPYRIIYRVRPDRVRIIAVVHGAKALPEEPPE